MTNFSRQAPSSRYKELIKKYETIHAKGKGYFTTTRTLELN